MRENCALWMTPKSIDRLADHIPNKEIVAAIRAALEEYLSVACKPLLATPTSEVERLPDYVTRFAIAGTEARMRLVSLTILGLGDDAKKFLDFSAILLNAVPEVRELAAHLFERQYLECFEMGIRVYVRSLQSFLRVIRPGKPEITIRSEHRQKFYEWVYIASCLDICVTSILWYLEEDISPSRASIAQELCFLLKEYALAYGAIVRVIFDTPKAKEG